MPKGSKVRVVSTKINAKLDSIGTVVDHRGVYVVVDFDNLRDLQYIFYLDLEPALRLL